MLHVHKHGTETAEVFSVLVKGVVCDTADEQSRQGGSCQAPTLDEQVKSCSVREMFGQNQGHGGKARNTIHWGATATEPLSPSSAG